MARTVSAPPAGHALRDDIDDATVNVNRSLPARVEKLNLHGQVPKAQKLIEENLNDGLSPAADKMASKEFDNRANNQKLFANDALQKAAMEMKRVYPGKF